jgi:hypothetical protein
VRTAGARAGIRGVLEWGATRTAKIPGLEVYGLLSTMVHSYSLTLHGVFA